MKKFSISCDFNGQMAPFTIYVGDPKAGHHPVSFQSNWLSKERGGTIPQEVMDSLTKLKDLADKNGVSFEELCVYALGSAQEEAEEDTEAPTEVTTEVEAAPTEETKTEEAPEITDAAAPTTEEETKLETQEEPQKPQETIEESTEKEAEEDKKDNPDIKEGA